VTKLNLSLKIILSFALVLLAALILLLWVVFSADQELTVEKSLWPGMWGLGNVAGSIGPTSDQSAVATRLSNIEGSVSDDRASGYLREAAQLVNDLARAQRDYLQAQSALAEKISAFRLSALELALARPESVPAQPLSELLTNIIKTLDKTPLTKEDLEALKNALAAFGGPSASPTAGANAGPIAGPNADPKASPNAGDDSRNFLAKISELSSGLDDLVKTQNAFGQAQETWSKAAQAASREPKISARSEFNLWPRVLVGLLVLLALSAFLVWLLNAKVIKPLSQIQGWLDESSQDVTKTALSLSRASGSLARGASENTKAVLDAISSLEVLLNTAKRNADHAGQAKELIDRAKSFVDEAHVYMIQINTSINM
jgi:methyl-accepting chemotaxis protein